MDAANRCEILLRMMRLLLLIALLLSAHAAPAAQAGTTTIGVKDPAITYLGRVDFSVAGAARAAWPATAIGLRFTGTAVSALLQTNGTDVAQVIVDGVPAKTIALTTTMTAYPIAAGLPDAVHTVQIVKRTEAWSLLSFGGFQLAAGTTSLPAPQRSDRRIEFYGDSITCGYGDEASNEHEHFTSGTENAWLAYGPVAARAVGAEWSVIAVSGIKLWPDNMLPPRHDDVLRPWDHAPKADFHAWVPQVVVINLGTNDFGHGVPEEHGWCAAMQAFIATMRSHYADCHVYLVTGSMMTGAPLTTLQHWLDAIVAQATSAGDTRIHRLDFAPQQAADGFGADWHPSLVTHHKMANALAAALRKDLHWQ